MKRKSKTKTVLGGNLPGVTLAVAEKSLRDIARRNGEAIHKRRSVTLKNAQGDGYCVIDPTRNIILHQSFSRDGCDLSLSDLAARYRKDNKNTGWQQIIIKAILAGKISE